MKFKKAFAAFMAVSTVLTFAGCNSDSGSGSSNNNSSTGNGGSSQGDSSNTPSNDSTPSTDGLTLKVLTHRTDRIQDKSLEEMTKSFEEANNCKVEYQAFQDYDSDLANMMSTTEYGDVLMIPDNVALADLSNFFEPLGTYDELSAKYQWMDHKMYDGTVYGIPHVGTANGGIAYNIRVWNEAGITELPKTPEDFLACLDKIKNSTDALPYYTNFSASWTINQWPSLVECVAGDANYQDTLLKDKADPFAEDTAYYKVFKLLYDVYSDDDLHEADPMTTDWDASKKLINDGKIATMVMGGWAISQFQAAGDNFDDIGYMPAPFTVDGKQYGMKAADKALGINKNRSDEIKALGRKYIEWFVSDSGFAQKEGCIPTPVGSELPANLVGFKDCVWITKEATPEGLQGVWDDIDNAGELGFYKDDSANFKIRLAEAAFRHEGEESFKSIMEEMSGKYIAARDANEKFVAFTG